MGQAILKAWVEPEVVTRKFLNYATEFHKLRVTDTAVDRFLKSIGKISKKGRARYTDKEKHLKMVEFIIKRSKIKATKMTGEQWEASMRSLLLEVFKEPWDRDHDKDGKEMSTSQQFADKLANARGAATEAATSAI